MFFHINPIDSNSVVIDFVNGQSLINTAVYNLAGNGHVSIHYKFLFVSDNI